MNIPYIAINFRRWTFGGVVGGCGEISAMTLAVPSGGRLFAPISEVK